MRILIGVTSAESLPFLTEPDIKLLKEIDKKGGISFLKGLDLTNYKENMTYFNNETVIIKGYSKTQYSPDKKITLKLYKEDEENPVYENDITDGKNLNPGTDGNTANFTFEIDTIKEGFENGVYRIELDILQATDVEISGLKQGYILIDQETNRPSVKVLTPESGSTVTPYTTISGDVYDDDGIMTIYTFIVRENNEFFENPPENYKTWGNYNSSDVKGEVISFGLTPKISSWSVKSLGLNSKYRAYFMAEDNNEKNAANEGYYDSDERILDTSVMKKFDFIEFTQRTSDVMV